MIEDKVLIFEMSKPGRTAYSLPPSDVSFPGRHRSGFLEDMSPETLVELPEVSELHLIRH